MDANLTERTFTMPTTKKDVYQIVTDTIIESLERGVVPWRRPWAPTLDGVGHRNLVSKKGYRGINPFILEATAQANDWNNPYWLTYKQAEGLGGQVRAGSTSTLVTFWKTFKIEGKNGDKDKTIPMLRYFRVFNIAQVDGVECPTVENLSPMEPIEAADIIVKGYAMVTKHGGDSAHYSPSDDTVTMPIGESFISPSNYYATWFHELGHSTGHKTRLDRFSKDPSQSRFGSENYSREELCAEMTAAMLCGVAGISEQTIESSASYIASWLTRLQNDPKLVIQAAGKAQKAADLILGRTYDN